MNELGIIIATICLTITTLCVIVHAIVRMVQARRALPEVGQRFITVTAGDAPFLPGDIYRDNTGKRWRVKARTLFAGTYLVEPWNGPRVTPKGKVRV